MDITVIIACYNPDLNVFSRCLKSLLDLKKDKLSVEFLLIDNNSNPQLSTLPGVQDFLLTCENSKIIIEKRQGSAFSLLCGFKNSRGSIIITYGEDNEPFPDYLVNAKKLIDEHNNVGVFGPGIINVDYLEGAPRYFNKYKYVFQQISVNGTFLTNSSIPDRYYPYGTGMIIKREVALDYLTKAEAGYFTAEGRSGTKLTGCEDLQIVWNCIKNGNLSVGISSDLRINHLIHARKTTFTYWKKLSYGGGYSWLPARFEIFPEERISVSNTGLEVRKSILRLCKVFVYNFYKPRFFLISVASQLGILDSIYHLNKKKTPFYLNWTRSLLGLGK